MLTEEQVKARVRSIGSSDAAAVLGLSRYKTPLAVWSEKTGAIIPADISKKLSIRLGHRMEQVVAELFEEETGKKVKRANETRVHPDYPFLTANLDRVVIGEDAILEAKTTGERSGGEWADDEVPPEYIIQCLHQLMVTGKDRCYIACLIGGNKEFTYKIIERDEEMIAELLKKEVAFWNDCVIGGKMPAVTSDDMSTLLGLFPKSEPEGDPLMLGEDAEAVVFQLEDAKQQEKTVKEKKDRLGNELRAMLGSSSSAQAGPYKITWKSQGTGIRLNTERIKLEAPEIYAKYGEAGETRVLRVSDLTKKIKKG